MIVVCVCAHVVIVLRGLSGGVGRRLGRVSKKCVQKCVKGFGGLSGGVWGRFGGHWEADLAPWEHFGQVKRNNENMRCYMMVDLALFLFMFWRVPESTSWSCGRLGFETIDISLILYDMFRHAVDFMNGIN